MRERGGFDGRWQWASDDSRWRRAQSFRRQQLTSRGRATLALLSGLAAALAIIAGLGGVGVAPPDAEPLPAVFTAAPRVRPAPPPPPEVLERLPAGRRALDLPSAAPPGFDSSPSPDTPEGGRLYEWVSVSQRDARVIGPLRIEYTLDADLTRIVFRILKRARVEFGHVILLDPTTGRVLTYVSTDVVRFSGTEAYPAASLVKIITAAAALGSDPALARLPCRYRGSPYRLTRSRIDPPRTGKIASLRQALATSNNQCFAQLAVHAVGEAPLREAIASFGWLSSPAPDHAAGTIEMGEDRYDLARVGCGLAGSRITPLHGAQLAATLAHGELISPRWIERIFDAGGRELPLPALRAPRRVLTPEIASDLRMMLVETTQRGTARGAFHRANGRPLLGSVQVAGKTGSLSGSQPAGRYEWFIGVAPADEPRIAVAVLLLQGHLWWRNAAQIAAEVLRVVFCPAGACKAESVERWTHPRVELPTETGAAG